MNSNGSTDNFKKAIRAKIPLILFSWSCIELGLFLICKEIKFTFFNFINQIQCYFL